jgi:hypothetical protein
MKKTLSILLLLFININCLSQIVYVKNDAAGLNNGTSWENAFNDLSYAIHNTVSGQIWVASGTYKPSTDLNGLIPTDVTLKTFKLKANIAIYGGFTGVETNLNQRNWINNITVLSGDIGIAGVYTDNVRNVVSSEYSTLNNNTILDGLTIRGGYAYFQYDGAGIYVQNAFNSSFVLRNCIIENNYSFHRGGGLYVYNCDPIIENNIFRNNQAFEGGAIHLNYSDALISNNQIINNSANNYPTSGYSSLSGGGIYVSSYSSPEITNNLIKNNFSLGEGGGVTINSNYHTTFKNNIVIGNSSRDGAGLFLEDSKSYLFNNIFAKNNAAQDGGAIYMDYVPGQLEFINNTVVLNTATSEGGGLYLSAANTNIVNSIFYNNISPIGSQISSNSYAGDWSPDFRFCNIQGGINGISIYGNPIVYENNIDNIPMFVDTNNNNFRLNEQSTSIDSGTINSSIFSSIWTGSNGQVINFPITDLEGNQRIISSIDIGAYEFGSSLSVPNLERTKFIIYPNPSSGIYFINSIYESFSVYNSSGIEIIKSSSKSSSVNLDLTNYPNGLYFITFIAEGKRYSYKLIKE